MSRNVRPDLLLASLFAFLSSLAGCVDRSGLQSQSARLENSDLQRDDVIEHATKGSPWPSGDWWRAYHDPQLNQWVDRAMRGNLSLAIAQTRVRKAMAVAGVTQSRQAVQAQLNGSAQRKHWSNDNFYGPGNLANSSSWDNNLGTGLSYDLDLWGGLQSATEKAQNQLRQQAAETRAAALQIQAAVVSSYIELARHHADLKIAEQQLQQRKMLVKLAEHRLHLGLGTQQDVNQAQLPLPEAHRQIDLLHEAIALSHNQLAELAGQGPGAAQDMQPPALKLEAAQGLPASLPLDLLGRRPDVQARRWQVAAAARDIEVAEAEFYPNINLLGNLGFLATQGNVLGFLSHKKLTASAGPALSLPIFDGGRRRNQLGVANADYDEAVDAYNQTLVHGLKQVSNQLIGLHSLKEQAHFVSQALGSAERDLQLAKVAHERGLTDYQPVLLAQTEVFNQQHLQQQILAARLNAQALLWVELGGGNLPDNDSNDLQLIPRAAGLRL